MASLKHQETLPKTMEIFDTFKAVEEDKDSDEESFHLHLEEDDNDKDLDTVENEDDILNKFVVDASGRMKDDKEESEMNCVKTKKKEDNSNSQENGSNTKSEVDDNIKETRNDVVEKTSDSTEENHVKECAENVEKPESENNEASDAQEQQQEETADDKETAAEEMETNTDKEEKTDSNNCTDKNTNLEQEDLLDISIIRDVDEDNAKAVADNVSEAPSSDKSDNDDQEDHSEKNHEQTEETEEESEHLDNQISNDKEVNSEGEIAMETEITSEEMEVTDETLEKNDEIEATIEASEVTHEEDEVKTKDGKMVEENKESSTDENEIKVEDSNDASLKNGDASEMFDMNEFLLKKKDANVSSNLGKRSLSENSSDELENSSKKAKLSILSNGPDISITSEKEPEYKNLINFQKFMKSNCIKENQLTLADLEQFCLQKITEYIMHKTPFGEQHQVNKKQEQLIDNLRKEIQHLSKQVNDLEIVNKRLMNDVNNGPNGKPLVPLKITRSVGLQVKLFQNEPVVRRRSLGTASGHNRPGVIATPSPTGSLSNRNKTITPTRSPVVRQITPTKSPAQTPPKTTAQPSNTILSQVLQNITRVVPNVNKKTVASRPKEPGVIDLTDEEDKAGKAAARPILKTSSLNKVSLVPMPNSRSKPVKTVQSTGTVSRNVTTLSGVRLTHPGAVKNSIAIPASVVTTNTSGSTQYMYVVQPQQLVTSTAQGGTQKAVLLNFQTSNGLLTPTLGTSSVSVIPTKSTNPVQLKSVSSSMPRKTHPAPLPAPPPVHVSSHLKPLLPKPHLTIRKTDNGIILQWRMPYDLDAYENIASYQLYAYQETSAPPNTEMWRKVGDVKALALPMACTLTQFADKNKYFFAVRSVDVHKRIGAFSDPEEISL